MTSCTTSVTGPDADSGPASGTGLDVNPDATSGTGSGAGGAAAGSEVERVPTGAGEARITWRRARDARLVLAVGHGAGGGVEARDLRALAAVLPEHGVSVALVEQPWRVAGKKVAPAPRTLDEGWRGIWPAVARSGLPVVSGGRSAGARVACRTAGELGAAGVLALGFPLHPPGRPERSRAEELSGVSVPLLVVQGAKDPFGRPEEFPEGLRPGAVVPHADHGFAVPKRAPLSQDDAVRIITDAVTGWISTLA
ncbi:MULTISPECIES: alpha/beta family hydrolase [Streptomyces]|uniref:alpha/beta hydrolase family protein n=1 Tax=Streptomyces TaxID=1883 RepID=UPI001F0E9538|nr:MULTISPECIES: alpha/beta family hydrolase [Streptomyces]MDH6225071.1 putative alpha/beta-hydrolase family hydrolase [Streptomyces sp. MJP52]